MSAGLVKIWDAARVGSGDANNSTKPILLGRSTGDGSERIAPGRPVILRVLRDRDGTSGALDGTLIVHGANLPHPQSGNTGVQVMKGSDGTTGRTVFATALVYAAFANYNMIVIVNGLIIEQGAGAGKWTVADAAGLATVTFGTALNVDDVVEIYKVTPLEVLATGAHGQTETTVTARSVMWIARTVAAATFSRTLVTLTPEA